MLAASLFIAYSCVINTNFLVYIGGEILVIIMYSIGSCSTHALRSEVPVKQILHDLAKVTFKKSNHKKVTESLT